MSLPESPCYTGYLTFEEIPGSDDFTRRFFVLNRSLARLECYTDHIAWVAN